MDVNEKFATMDSSNTELFRQSIFKRDDTLFGCGIQAHCAGENFDVLKVCRTLSAALLDVTRSEKLTQSHLTATSSMVQPAPLMPDTFGRIFITIGSRNLLDTVLIEYITRVSDALKIHDKILTVSIDEFSFPLSTTEEKRTLISHIYLLKDSGIDIAFSSYNLLEGSTKTQSTPNIFNYLIVDLQKNELSEKLNATPELLNRLYDQMNIMTHTKKVRFIAERIELEHHQVLARSLPFDFFQGDYYSPQGIRK